MSLGWIVFYLTVWTGSYWVSRSLASGRPKVSQKWFHLVDVVRDILAIVWGARNDWGFMLIMSITLLFDLASAVNAFRKGDDDDDDEDRPPLKLSEIGKRIVEKTQNALQPVSGPLPQPI